MRFEYHAPASLDEALRLLSEYGEESALMAGGTDLLVKMKQRLVEPRRLINIKRISELSCIEEGRDGIYIGAATKLRTIERSELIRENLPSLHEAVRSIGSVQVRNMATIGGNLCNASPAADSATALLSLDATARVVSSYGSRAVPLERFFVSPGKTILKPNQLLAEVIVPHLMKNCGASFMKVGRTSLDIATVNVGTVLTLRDEVVLECRMALGAVAPTPMRVHEAEDFLKGKKPGDKTLANAARIAKECIKPITDVRATADYRKEASETLLRDSLKAARDRALGRRQ